MPKSNREDLLSYVSEFQNNGYETTKLHDLFVKYVQYKRELPLSAKEAADTFDYTTDSSHDQALGDKLFAGDLFELRSLENLNEKLSKKQLANRYDCLKPYCSVKYVRDFLAQYQLPFRMSSFDMGTDQVDVRSEQHITDFTSSIHRLSRELGKPNALDIAETMVANFQKISSEIVFNPSSRMLYSIAFRTRCEFLNLLLCPKKTRSVEVKKEKSLFGNPLIYFYDTLDPFVCASLLYINQEFSRIENQLYEKGASSHSPFLLADLRLALFIRRAEQEFKRYMYLNHQTYKVHLNRHWRSITAMPYLQASSLESIKPIRLFEKIQQYVEARLLDAKATNKVGVAIEIKVCIIGYTEPSCTEGNTPYSYEERELFDLAQAIANWLEEKAALGRDPEFERTKLSISIKNLYNEYDIPRVLIKNEDINRSMEISVNGGQYTVKAQTVEISYDWFNYNTTFFTDVIMEKNDLIFLLDCPFLTEEDYDMKRGFSLKEYCESIRQWDHFDLANYPSLDQKQHNPMKILSSQYNRIMASTTRDAGAICRVFRDYWVTDIAKKLKRNAASNPPRKVVYIFTSETDGLAYSTLSSHPVCRMEQYEGKTFNIFRLANKKASMLPYRPEGSRMRIRISLWRMLKYASVDYALNKFREALQHRLYGDEKEFTQPLDIHALYRHISIVISEKECFKEEHRYQLEVNLEADRLAIARILDRNGLKAEDSIPTLFQFVKDFVSTIYQTVYFPTDTSHEKFGDDILRSAFSMNLYGAAEDLWSLWFWHRYRQALSNQTYSEFDVSYPQQNDFKDISKERSQDVSASDFFKDKKLYDLVFRSLESSSTINPAIKSLLYNVPEFYEIYGDHGYEAILGNILKMYDDFTGNDDDFRENCRIALSNLL